MRGASRKVKDNMGLTPMDYAVKIKNFNLRKEAIDLLVNNFINL